MGELFNAFGTIGRFDSYVTLACSCLVGCILVGYSIYHSSTDKKFEKSRGVFIAAMACIAVCLCLCGAVYVFATHKSKHVAALGGFMAYAQ